ncbi:hypothetical protein [Streptomyces sp. MBT49]|nr:hypothetical protein [Streptomyces sp. MBT49]
MRPIFAGHLLRLGSAAVACLLNPFDFDPDLTNNTAVLAVN